MTETGFSPTTGKAKTPLSVNYSEASSSVIYEVTSGDCKVSLTIVTGTYGDITLTYTLEDDRGGVGLGIASIKPQYASTQGGSFSDMTKGTGGNNKTNLATSATPTTYTFVWNTVADLGIDFKGRRYIKIIAYDRDDYIGDTTSTDIRAIDIDNAPDAPTITYPTSGYFSKDTTPQIIGTIPDMRAGNSDAHIKIEVSSDSNFGTIVKTFESNLDQTGWQYDSDGAGAWLNIPFTGIPIVTDPTLIGNSWRYTVQTEDELELGNKYLRAYCGGAG